MDKIVRLAQMYSTTGTLMSSNRHRSRWSYQYIKSASYHEILISKFQFYGIVGHYYFALSLNKITTYLCESLKYFKGVQNLIILLKVGFENYGCTVIPWKLSALTGLFQTGPVAINESIWRQWRLKQPRKPMWDQTTNWDICNWSQYDGSGN